MNVVKLYVMGKGGPTGEAAINQLKAIMDSEFKGQYSLEVVDLLENPEKAAEDNVFATPTVIRLLPEPVRKILGDLSDREKVLVGLELKGNT